MIKIWMTFYLLTLIENEEQQFVKEKIRTKDAIFKFIINGLKECVAFELNTSSLQMD